MLDGLPNREKACGFIAGQQELGHWEPPDLFQFYHDTTPLIGTLDGLIPVISREDVQRAIRLGACNIYHICGHNLVHGKKARTLRGLYKSAVFTAQAIYFDQSGSYIKQKAALALLLQPDEKAIVQAAIDLKAEPALAEDEFDHYTDLLFNWAAGVIGRYPSQGG